MVYTFSGFQTASTDCLTAVSNLEQILGALPCIHTQMLLWFLWDDRWRWGRGVSFLKCNVVAGGRCVPRPTVYWHLFIICCFIVKLQLKRELTHGALHIHMHIFTLDAHLYSVNALLLHVWYISQFLTLSNWFGGSAMNLRIQPRCLLALFLLFFSVLLPSPHCSPFQVWFISCSALVTLTLLPSLLNILFIFLPSLM